MPGLMRGRELIRTRGGELMERGPEERGPEGERSRRREAQKESGSEAADTGELAKVHQVL